MHTYVNIMRERERDLNPFDLSPFMYGLGPVKVLNTDLDLLSVQPAQGGLFQ